MVRQLSITLMLGALLVVAGGCGGSQPKSAPPPGGTTLGGAPAGPPLGAQPRAAAKPKPKAAAARSGRTLPDAPDSHRFEVGEGIANFDVVPVDDPRSGAMVALVEPPVGSDSSTVDLVEADGRPLRQPAVSAAPSGFSAVPEAGFAEDGLPARIRVERDGSEMVRVPAGLFLQGHDGDDPATAPLHPVELDAYYIDAYEVTLRQYMMFWKETRPLPGRPVNEGAGDDLPALGISWRDATAYAAWAGKALPTEAEWEKAARGPDRLTYPWGNGRVLWQRPRTTTQIDPVGAYPADRSIYGAFDLCGNAREWCADWFADDAYRQAAGTTGALVTNPTGPRVPSQLGHRVVRGSSAGWELWRRSSAPMLAPTDDLGFRCVLRSSVPSGTRIGPPPGAPQRPVAPGRGT